jgi:exodeoxyribonuclease V alpha subunit
MTATTLSPALEREALAGLVERVTDHNPEPGFCVLWVKVRGARELITVVGAAAISAGELVQASGSWVNDRTHGVQFKAAGIRDSKGVDLLPHPTAGTNPPLRAIR